jgi:hypothetical protein
MERVKIVDSDGALLTLNELRAAVLDNSEDHDRGDDKDHDLG